MRLGLGGGCHWCTEAVFQALIAVQSVEQGWIASDPPHEAFSEAVIVTFDADALPLETLIDIHLRTHSSTSAHSMRGKYRSAIYVMDEAQGAAVQATLTRLQTGFDAPLVTQVLPFRAFKASDDRFQNYYAADPARPFCTTYIDPKLTLLRSHYGAHLA
jgi:peptide-methionine (S)-S-oxide reductase